MEEEKPQFELKYSDKMQCVVPWKKGSVFVPSEERPCKENSCDAKEDKAEKGLPPLRCASLVPRDGELECRGLSALGCFHI